MNSLQSWRLGDAVISKIPERETSGVAASFLFPQWNSDRAMLAASALPPGCVDTDSESVALSTHSWLVQVEGQAILIDTASGNDKERPLNPGFHRMNTRWLENLHSAGVLPEAIDSVLLTHLHVDHVGWNTVKSASGWTATFPHARYYFSDAEYQFYRQPDNVQDPSAGVFEDSVQPIVDAGLDVRIGADFSALPAGFQLHRFPGHSHDHLGFSLTRGGETALFWGDVLHSPLQVALPEWNSVFCEFPQQALHSRQQALALAEKQQALVFTTHFPGSSAGRVVRHAEGLSWQAA